MPALTLVLLSPLIAEYLLGDFSVRQIGFLIVLAPQYGCGALVIRDLARRHGRGWPTILWLAVAFALVEEGLLTQSLFNPNYAGQRLLDYGYISALGTSLNWTLFVLTLHVVWSMASAIALAEAFAGDRWDQTWLGPRGLGITAGLFVLGSAFTAISTRYLYPFVASPREFLVIALLSAAAAWIAFSWHSTSRQDGRPAAPPAIAVAGATFLLASAFHVLHNVGGTPRRHALVVLLGMVALEAIAILVIRRWARTRAWGPKHTLAAASGAVLTYSWVGLWHMVIRGTTALGVKTTNIDIVGQGGLIALMLVVIAVGFRRLTQNG